jgi:hypothetical protein
VSLIWVRQTIYRGFSFDNLNLLILFANYCVERSPALILQIFSLVWCFVFDFVKRSNEAFEDLDVIDNFLQGMHRRYRAWVRYRTFLSYILSMISLYVCRKWAISNFSLRLWCKLSFFDQGKVWFCFCFYLLPDLLESHECITF